MSEIGAMVLANLGLEIPAERAEGIARALEAMLAAERAATRDLPFEQEPSNFLSELEKESP
jgi:hypothetical protein